MGTCCKPAGGRWKKARPREFSNAQHVLFVGRLPRYVRVFEFRGSKFFNRAELGQYLSPDVNDRHDRRRYDYGDHSRWRSI